MPHPVSETVTTTLSSSLFRPIPIVPPGSVNFTALENKLFQTKVISSASAYQKPLSSPWITESTPLPEGTILGVSNFNDSLGFPSTNFYDCVSVKPYADGTWGVSMFMPDAGGMVFLEKHMVYDGISEVESSIGDHPWSDITFIDWASLPLTEAEALTQLDRSDWAVVNNPRREDRLHLRAAPDADAASYGKYYNRTPVRIRLSRRNDICTELTFMVWGNLSCRRVSPRDVGQFSI